MLLSVYNKMFGWFGGVVIVTLMTDLVVDMVTYVVVDFPFLLNNWAYLIGLSICVYEAVCKRGCTPN